MMSAPGAIERRVQAIHSHLSPAATHELAQGLQRMDTSAEDAESLWQNIPEVRQLFCLQEHIP